MFSPHPLVIFALASFAYVVSLLIFQLLVPRIGVPSGDESASDFGAEVGA